MRKFLIAWILFIFVSNGFAATDRIKRAAKPIPEHYIVLLDDDADVERTAALLAHMFGGVVLDTFSAGIKAFLVRMTESEANALKHHPAVRDIEEDGEGEISGAETQLLDEAPGGAAAHWHLDRIDQPNRPLDHLYRWCSTWRNTDLVDVFVFDSGVRRDHQEFLPIGGGAPRVSDGFDALCVQPPCGAGSPTSPTISHGTAVASLIGGISVGVSRRANIHPVRTIFPDGSTSVSNIVRGVDWVLTNSGEEPRIANFSNYVRTDGTAIDEQIERLLADGFVVVASANNHNVNPCGSTLPETQTPARMPGVITVGGLSDVGDFRIDRTQAPCLPPNDSGCGSNFGPCVDIFAPGFAMRTATRDATYTYEVLTNTAATSYAAAVVSGIAARYVEQNPDATKAEIESYLLNSDVYTQPDPQSPATKIAQVNPGCTVPGTPPVITAEPQPQTITLGNYGVLSVLAEGGPPLAYQWYQTPIGGAETTVPNGIAAVVAVAPQTTTDYRVLVSNASGSVSSVSARISVCATRAITAQPANRITLYGYSTTMSVSVSPASGASYQWYRGWPGDFSSPFIGATSSSASTGPLTESTRFWVRIYDACSGINSDSAFVIVICSRATISQDPQSQTVPPGGSATLSVVASGSGTLSYQWYRDGNLIVGANASSYNTGPIYQATDFQVLVWAPDCEEPEDGVMSAVATVAPVATSQVSFRTFYGYYLAAAGGGGSNVIAPRQQITSEETFTLVDLNGGSLQSGDEVQIKAANGMYVVAEDGGGNVLNANRPGPPGPWETFTIWNTAGPYSITSGTSVNLLSNGDWWFNKYYVVAEGGGASAVNCNRSSAGEWETFVLIVH